MAASLTGISRKSLRAHDADRRIFDRSPVWRNFRNSHGIHEKGPAEKVRIRVSDESEEFGGAGRNRTDA